MLNLKDINLFMLNQKQFSEIANDENFPRAINYRLMLVLPQVAEQTKGGIFLPESIQENALFGNNVGRVISMGKSVGRSEDLKEVSELNVGDYVKYNPHMFEAFFFGGQRFVVVLDQHISNIVPDPAVITDGIFTTYKIEGMSHAN